MEYLSADKILVVDLSTSEINEEELSEELVEQKIGGAAINKHLYETYADDDPIVIGTGLLTGTLCPGAAAGIITAKSPRSGKLCHSPFTFKVGLELQYAGFDHIVIKGQATKPVFLWIHDGVTDITDAGDVWGKDTWQTTDAWRKAMGEDLIQTLVIGPAGENGSDLAQVCCNYWASGDRFGCGKLFGEKRLKGIALRGMGLLEIADPEEFVDIALELLEDIKDSNDWEGKKGLGDILTEMGAGEVSQWLQPLIHRHSACYNTPYATNSFAFLDLDPSLLAEPDLEDPGFLISDPFAPLGFHKAGFSAEEACRAMKACAQYGIDAAAVAQLCGSTGLNSLRAVTDALPTLSGDIEIPGRGVFSPCCPTQPLFGRFEDADDQAAWWERRQAVAYIFGIHPTFAVMAPDLSEESLLELASVGTELELTEELLDEAVAYLAG